jgi:hypothetical protein
LHAVNGYNALYTRGIPTSPTTIHA